MFHMGGYRHTENGPPLLSVKPQRRLSHLLRVFRERHYVSAQRCYESNPLIRNCVVILRRGDNLNDRLSLDAVDLNCAIGQECGDVWVVQTCRC